MFHHRWFHIFRLEYEVSKLREKVDGMEALQVPSGEDHVGTSEKTAFASVEVSLLFKTSGEDHVGKS